jgi:NAD(P)-dependent dehydrogenase (short-subunit alcohol dehydrogenase family)
MAPALDQRVAIVTGGASGIGRATAVRFAANGCAVLVADRDGTGAADVAHQIGVAGGRATSATVDVCDEAAVDTMVTAYADECGRLDAVVASAGINAADGDGLAIDLDSGAFRTVMEVNVFGSFFVARAAARWLVSHELPGSLILLASVLSRVPLPGATSYCTSKAAVWMMAKVMALELAEKNIRVNAIGPGWIDTPMTAFLHDDQDAMTWALGMTPVGRLGTADDVASTALFLASDESSFYTGQLLHPAGGMYTD